LVFKVCIADLMFIRVCIADFVFKVCIADLVCM